MMYRDTDRSSDSFPHDQVRDMISRMEDLTAANVNVNSSLSSWADDVYLSKLYKPIMRITHRQT
jgi:hypothetical protein